MTGIVGVKTPQGVFIGGDSATTNDSGLQTILAGGKVFFIGEEKNRMLLGCTTSCRMMQLLHYELQLPAYEDGMDVETYLVTKFVNAARTCLKDGGFAQKEDEKESGGNFLIGYRGRLFEVQNDYQVSEPTNGYEAVGSGAKFALGSLYATPHLPPEQRIELALQAATYHNAYVRPPFLIHCLRSEQEPAEVLTRRTENIIA
jgi:ATP-dependent protease HslVU (ClpYQ) peptidase subunit